MGLICKENNGIYTYGIWEMSEDEDTLKSLSGCEAPIDLRNPSRRIEYLAVRALAKNMGVRPSDISYLPSGKPFLEGSELGISISHTKNFVAFLIGKEKMTGIDIETRSDKVRKVRGKFMLPEEEKRLTESGADQTTGLLLHWCTKESLFKAAGKSEIDSMTDFRIDDFSKAKGNKGSFFATALRKSIRFQVDYRIEESYVLTCCFSI